MKYVCGSRPAWILFSVNLSSCIHTGRFIIYILINISQYKYKYILNVTASKESVNGGTEGWWLFYEVIAHGPECLSFISNIWCNRVPSWFSKVMPLIQACMNKKSSPERYDLNISNALLMSDRRILNHFKEPKSYSSKSIYMPFQRILPNMIILCT